MAKRLAKRGAVGELVEVLDVLSGGDVEEDFALLPVEKSNDELRYTLAPIYAPGAVDAHDEYAESDDLRKALWDFSLKGDKSLKLQHGNDKVGDIVELVQWPTELETEMEVPGTEVKKRVTLPAGTVYAGVRWTEDAWPMVKSGELKGYSMGGAAVRIRDAADSSELLKIGHDPDR